LKLLLINCDVLPFLASVPYRGFTVESTNRSWPYTLCTFKCQGKKTL